MSVTVYSNATIATMSEVTDQPYGLIEGGALVVAEGRIAWVGPALDLPEVYGGCAVEDLEGRLLTPALIDCHSHLVYGGNRALEFEMRQQGATYEDIARAGGGIVSTVRQTRALSEEALLAQALPRLDAFLAEGVGTIEIKSGYGLTLEDEVKMLRVARRLGQVRPVKVVTTFLGAHAVPADFEGDGDAYLDRVCLPALKEAAALGLVDAVDGFCEGIAFSPAQVARVFDLAQSLGLPVKLHAEQLSDLKGAVLAASYGALSVDHLEFLDPADVPLLKQAGTVAVLLPGAFYTLRESKLPPLNTLRANGVPLALASDCNPGSSPLTSLLLCMNMGCTLFNLTPEEALAGVTRNAAAALGLAQDRGALEPGKQADLALWDLRHPAELSYHMGFNPLIKRVLGGVA